MKVNVGKADRSIRIILGLLLLAGGLYFEQWFWAVGIVFLVTALFRWCPMYKLFGVNTCEARTPGTAKKG
ncbi:MAG: DUF2892 domain-containing protein [Flavobacteriales bacterium]|jgi:hypothetical protein